MSETSSHANSITAKVEEAPMAAPVTLEGDEKDTLHFDWNQKLSCGCCCCSFMLQLIFTAAVGSFLFGFNLGLLNTAISYISWDFGWCKTMRGGIPSYNEHAITDCTPNTLYQSFMSTAIFIGAAIGSMTGGGFMSFGRRGMLLFSLYLFVLGIISSCVANSFSSLLWARLLCGYGVGLISVVCPTYMSEVTPPSVRGKYGVFHQLFITIGLLVAALIGLPTGIGTPLPGGMDPHYMGSAYNPEGFSSADFEIPVFARVWWRVMLGIGIIPVGFLLYILTYVYTFETPAYYLEKGWVADAEMLLRKLLNKSDVSEELASINVEVQAGKKAKQDGVSLGSAWSRPDYRKVIIFGCVLSAFQQLGGINVFMASSTALFKQAGLDGNMAVVMTVVMNIINVSMTFPAVPLIERLGRRTLMIIGTIEMTIAVCPAMICYWALGADSNVTMWLGIVGCLLYVIGFAATYGPILWVYLFEIYPMEIKGAASGLATAFNWIAGIVMVFIQNYLEANVLYTIFTVMCGIGAVIVFFFLLETKGRELGDSPFIKRD